MDHPLVFELNTRCWLRELSDAAGTSLTLATVPESEFVNWKNSGFTHLWLMGVWKSGPKVRAVARAQRVFLDLCRQAFGAGGEENISGSPYAIAEYVVADYFGGNEGLARFREKLRRHGLGLILDFVPNHLGLDHEWLSSHPSLFVRSARPRPETFAAGGSWIAHGKDPHFPAWIDTAQLDYRLPATRAAMREVLRSVAEMCDGVRCDMAMLLLEDVFAATWADFPNQEPAARGEFWEDAITPIKKIRRDFLFVAEAYWSREARLQELGFDYAYDKEFYDCLTRRDPEGLRSHIQKVANTFSPVRFLENHDEPRVASLLTVAEQKAAAVLLLAQPGMRLLHDGQLTGRKLRSPVQLTRYLPESPDWPTKSFYDALLACLPKTAIGGSEMEYLQTDLAEGLLMQWKRQGLTTLVAVNLSKHRRRFAFIAVEPAARLAQIIFADPESKWNGTDAQLVMDLAPHGFLVANLVT